MFSIIHTVCVSWVFVIELVPDRFCRGKQAYRKNQNDSALLSFSMENARKVPEMIYVKCQLYQVNKVGYA